MTVKPDRPLKLVADEMARSKVGAAVVVEADKILHHHRCAARSLARGLPGLWGVLPT